MIRRPPRSGSRARREHNDEPDDEPDNAASIRRLERRTRAAEERLAQMSVMPQGAVETLGCLACVISFPFGWIFVALLRRKAYRIVALLNALFVIACMMFVLPAMFGGSRKGSSPPGGGGSAATSADYPLPPMPTGWSWSGFPRPTGNAATGLIAVIAQAARARADLGVPVTAATYRDAMLKVSMAWSNSDWPRSAADTAEFKAIDQWLAERAR